MMDREQEKTYTHPTKHIEEHYKNVLYVESCKGSDSGKSKIYVHVKGKIMDNIVNSNSVATIKKELENIGKPLFEVHKSCLVNISHVDINSLKPCGKNKFRLYFKNGVSIPVARGEKKDKLETELKKRDNSIKSLDVISFIPYQDITNFQDGIARVLYKGNYGFISQDNKMLIEPQYEEALYLESGLIRIKDINGYKIIDKNNNPITKCGYPNMGKRFFNDRIFVQQGNKLGFLDKKGEMIIPCIFDSAREFEHDLSLVAQAQHHFLIDKEGRFVFTLDSELLPEYEDEGENETLAQILAYYYFHKHSKDDESYKDYHRTTKFSDMMKVKEETLRLFKLENFELDFFYHYLKSKYNEVFSLSDKKIAVKDNDGKWKICGKSEKFIEVEPEYDFIDELIDGCAIVRKGDKYGAIDESGKTIIPLIFSRIYRFSEGLAFAAIAADNNKLKVGFIDKTGQEKIPFVFDSVFVGTKFEKGITCVSYKGKLFWINNTGKGVINTPPEYENYLKGRNAH